MPDTPDDPQGIATDTRSMRLRRKAVYDRARELAGADTDDARMELLGLKRATYYRVLREKGCNIGLPLATRVARTIGWTVDQTFERVA